MKIKKAQKTKQNKHAFILELAKFVLFVYADGKIDKKRTRYSVKTTTTREKNSVNVRKIIEI